MPHPKSGYRAKDGTKLPGVTTICNRFKESGGLLQWAFQQGASGAENLYDARDKAADIGTTVHSMWEDFLRTKTLTSIHVWPEGFTHEMIEQAMSSFQSAQRWLEDSQLEIEPLETPLTSEKYRYGGCPDALAIGRRGGSLADWKTGSGIYAETWMQMAAYIELIRENTDSDISDGVHLVRFGKNGGEFNHLHIPLNHPALVLAWEQFQALIGCFNRDKQLRKLI